MPYGCGELHGGDGRVDDRWVVGLAQLAWVVLGPVTSQPAEALGAMDAGVELRSSLGVYVASSI